ncbi:amino acid adenylation domain-containing protein [Chitinolyticbacter albus]|uniref:amino acid adenylation domain-containing protein n=1 Tax=Chitinolyticbacter albus TaxID=2961951 RepID=UPI00210A64A1|nr:amino acid adenylation domain-containing protein [Chitinolyticbacter albus]
MLELTAAQYGIWLGQRLDPANPAYWTAEVIELNGAMNQVAFEQAVRTAVAETDALWMRYREADGVVMQAPALQRDWAFSQRNLAEHDDPLAVAQAWMQAQLAVATDLETGPLFGAALFKLGAGRQLFFFQAHHIALDGYGYSLLQRRIAELYSAFSQGLPAPTGRSTALAPVVAEDQAYTDSEKCAAARAFWLAHLEDAPAPVLLAPPQAVGHGVRRARGVLPARLYAAWQDSARAASSDWTAWLIACVAAWLASTTGQRRLTLGLPVMSRLGSVAIGVPCMAMNIVPLRVTVDPAHSAQQLARQVATELRAIRPHQRYRYEWLRHDLQRVAGGRRLFGPVINLMPFDKPPAFGQLDAVSHPVSAGPVEDLAINVIARPDQVQFDLEANPDAYDDAALAAHRAALLITLSRLQAEPESPLAALLPFTSMPLAIVAGAALPRPPEPVLAALQRVARERPKHTAIEQDGVAPLSYAALLQRVMALAGVLAARGIAEGDRVVLLLPRTPDTLVALLAVLWAGGGYIPLDPASPAARIAMVLDDASPALVLTLRDHAALLPDTLPALWLDEATPPAAPLLQPRAVAHDALAYVIYTSGSTGRPNGVQIARNALAHFLAGASLCYGLSATDRVLQFAPLHFDASIEEIWGSLVHGATLVLRTDAMLESLPGFVADCERLAISVLDLPTAFWHELAFGLGEHQFALPACVRLVIIGGEAALAERVARWRSRVGERVLLLNTYGPTETTVICTTAALAGPGALDCADDAIPIGTPLPGLTMAVVDAALHPVAIGVEGELVICGDTLSSGYIDRPETTARRFVALTQLPGSPRGYRTGDRVVLGADGQLRFLGRLDDEFKLSGHRIDPTEVETALLACAGVIEVAVLGQMLENGGKRLAAFLVCDSALPEPATLRAQLARTLPAPAIPSAYVRLDRLPRNANNKIDRNALRALTMQASDSDAALTPLEATIAAAWRDVLGADAIAPESDFFALGGKSLQAIQVANRLALALQRDIPVSALFATPTVAELAQALLRPVAHAVPRQQAGQEFAPQLTIQAGSGTPLFCIHPAEGLAWCYFGLARLLPDVAIHALQARGLSGPLPTSFAATVADYVAQIRAVQPRGPYRLLGWSSGGATAQAMAARLQDAGETVELLALLDAYPASAWSDKPAPSERDALEALLDLTGDFDGATALSTAEILARLKKPGSPLAGFDDARIGNLTEVALTTMRQFRTEATPRYRGDLLLFRASQHPADAPAPASWQPYIAGGISVIDIDASHSAMTQPAPLAAIAAALAPRLNGV